MSKEDFDTLLELLDNLMGLAPCGGTGACIGHMNCNFGENGCYGESCAIEDVKDGIVAIMNSKKLF